MSKGRTLLIVGGASGVGKSTVLKALASHPQINTGDLFKTAMKIEDRDSIKSKSWVDFEEAVTALLGTKISENFATSDVVIVDTHFAAKVHNKAYRIGLRRDLLYTAVFEAIDAADSSGLALNVTVVYVYCDAYALLERRRLDVARKRELFPADCVKALRENSRCSVFYLHEAARARSDSKSNKLHTVQFLRVENIDLRKARMQLRTLVR